MPHFDAILKASFEARDLKQAEASWRLFVSFLPRPIGWYPKINREGEIEISEVTLELKQRAEKEAGS